MVDAGASSALRSWAMVDYDKRVAAREEAERLRSRGFWLGVRWLAVRCTNDVCLILVVEYCLSCLGLTWASGRSRARGTPAEVNTCVRRPLPYAGSVSG